MAGQACRVGGLDARNWGAWRAGAPDNRPGPAVPEVRNLLGRELRLQRAQALQVVGCGGSHAPPLPPPQARLLQPGQRGRHSGGEHYGPVGHPASLRCRSVWPGGATWACPRVLAGRLEA